METATQNNELGGLIPFACYTNGGQLMSFEEFPYPEYGCLFFYDEDRELGFVRFEPILHKLLTNAREYEPEEPAFILCLRFKSSIWFKAPHKHLLLAFDEITDDPQIEKGLRQLLGDQLQWSDVDLTFQETRPGGRALAKEAISSGSVDFKLRMVTGPEQLFKYTLFDKNRAKTYLRKSSLYLAAPSSFNDPYECPFEARKDEMENIGITCFSDRGDSIIMFSHYAAEHKGMCLVFDPRYFRSLKNKDGDDIHSSVRRVFYYEHFPKFNERSEPALIVTQKHVHWAYENEYRLLASNRKIPEPPGVYFFDPRALIGVIFGSCMADKNKLYLYKLSQRRKLSLKFWQAEKRQGEYKIDLHEIEYDKLKRRMVAKDKS